MEKFFLWFFSPQRNRYLIWGLLLSILGVILIPFIIGIPIAGFGFSLFTLGIIVSFANRFSKGEKVVGEFEKMFSRLKDFLKNLILSLGHRKNKKEGR